MHSFTEYNIILQYCRSGTSNTRSAQAANVLYCINGQLSKNNNKKKL